MSGTAQARVEFPLEPFARRNLLERLAKAAYEVYAHRAGSAVPFEHLPNDQWQAWKEVVAFLNSEPDCERCGQPLYCLDCDEDVIDGEHCPHCGELLTCSCFDDPDDDEDDEPQPTPAEPPDGGAASNQKREASDV